MKHFVSIMLHYYVLFILTNTVLLDILYIMYFLLFILIIIYLFLHCFSLNYCFVASCSRPHPETCHLKCKLNSAAALKQL